MPRTKTEDMIGKRYGRLTVRGIDHYVTDSKGWKRYYLACDCECGNSKVVLAYSLTQGLTKSCGCLQKEIAGSHLRTHGQSNTRLCHIWRDMHRRCEKANRVSYGRYGARGICVCSEWSGSQGFIHFKKWSEENGYKDDLSIDRIDNDKGYSPDNCRWTDTKTQANNTSTNKWIECNGEKHTLAQWSDITGISYGALKRRVDLWPVEEALGFKEHKTPHKDEVLYTIGNETHNVKEWCRIRNLSVDTVRYRRDHNWSPEEIFGFKERKHG